MHKRSVGECIKGQQENCRQQQQKCLSTAVQQQPDLMWLPLQAMARVSPRLSPLLRGCKQNREHWLEEAKRKHQEMQRDVEKHAGEERAENKNKDRRESTPS